MKLASLRDGRDGRLIVVSDDLQRGALAPVATLQAALEDWTSAEAALAALARRLDAGEVEQAFAVDPAALDAVLPRGPQFLDGSAFLAHNHILADAWGFEKRGLDEPPLMYQGISHRYLSPGEGVDFPDPAHEIDFEGEIGIITDNVPRGIRASEALAHVRLVLFLNDWSLRAFGPAEMRGGFGFIHAKPPSTLSPFAITPAALGDRWRDGRVHLPLHVWRNGTSFGSPLGSAMHFGFGELVAHAAATRALPAGTVIGSGTVSNYEAAAVGSACIAERRALDRLAGTAPTPYLRANERVRMVLGDADGSLLGAIDQKVVL